MKIFCIGFNKTGTTSLSALLSKNGISVAPQIPFESNLESYFCGNYSTFISMIKNDYKDIAFFQDVPFSLPHLYKTLDAEFPDSKFILTVRGNEDEWYNSLIRFYKKTFSDFANPERIASYVYRGILFKILTQAWGAPNNDPYNEKELKASYLNHIKETQEYFNGTNRFIRINLSDHGVVERLEKFLDYRFIDQKVPHLNKSK